MAYRTPESKSSQSEVLHDHTLLRVQVVGPQLLAQALHALLSTLDDLYALAPLSQLDQVLSVVERLQQSKRAIDVFVVQWSGDQDRDHRLLSALSAAGHRCLVVTSLLYPHELDFLQRVCWGVFFTTSPLSDLAAALRSIASGHSYFPDDLKRKAQRTLQFQPTSRQLVFHRERLEQLAADYGWSFSETEIHIFLHFTTVHIEEIAQRVHLHQTTVRGILSERVYKFLRLISQRDISNRFLALQALQEYGVIEYVLPPPSDTLNGPDFHR